MKKVPVNKLMSLVKAVQGKKPAVIIVSLAILIAGIFAVNKGYISEEALNIDLIVSHVESVFVSHDSVKAIVDSVNQTVIVDSVDIVKDSISVN